MTKKEIHRRDFWNARFIEKSHSEYCRTMKDDMKAKTSSAFADLCLEQYDITFNQTTKGKS